MDHQSLSGFTTYLDSPLGPLEISGDDTAVHSVLFAGAKHKPAPGRAPVPGEAPLSVQRCIAQLQAYFEGTLLDFDLSLLPKGTDFQRKVWDLLQKIPYGQTISYMELAKRLGNTKAIRAVGLANGSNPITIIIPCHRVIGSDGKLVGYGGDLWRKAWLLQHEMEYAPVPQGRLF